MVISDVYYRARKMGLRAYHACLQAHKQPYLPVLDELVPEEKALARVPLGIVQIPLNRVVGTATRARSNAFAPNFMPLLEPNSEFAIKWVNLYESVLADGMRQPITVLEYMNEYYLVEGNKRVSVMKYLDSVFVEAEVTRVLPKRTRENRAYFEFIDFEKDSGLNAIIFTQPGKYNELIEKTGHTPGVKWSSEDRMDLRSAYLYFGNEYKAEYGDNPPIPVADAFLLYLNVFSYEEAKSKSSAEIAADIRRLKDDFERGVKSEAVSLIMDRTEAHSGGLFSALFRPSRVKAAFIYHRPIEDSGWNYWHELGRINCENALGDKVETTVCVTTAQDQFDDEIDRMIKEGNRVIFATSPLMMNACVRPSLEHPDVDILCCSLLSPSHHVRSYYLRIYEAKFLIGMIAGMMAENDKIGYIGDYPIYGTPASINAFAIGARMVNPRAKVYLQWSTRRDFDPAHPFADDSIRVISNRDINAPRYSSMEYGLYALKDSGMTNLAIPVLDWSKFYQTVIESVLAGTFNNDHDGPSALDYWWGMSSDALDVVLSSRFDPHAGRLIHAIQSGIQSDVLWPFEGEIRAQDGRVCCGREDRLTPAQILLMDYLVDNVVGDMPKMEELKESARPLVDTLGLGCTLRPDLSEISWKFNE